MSGPSVATSRLEPYLRAPACPPRLDPGFRPAFLARRALEASAQAAGAAGPVWVAVEQPGGSVLARRTIAFPDDHPDAPASHHLVERLVKGLLWAHGGHRVWVDGPAGLVRAIQSRYRESDTGRFDASMMGSTIYGQPFEVVAAPHAAFPASRDAVVSLGGHLEGAGSDSTSGRATARRPR
ncbi:MAG TPA: hypothetical protein VEY67_03955 [Candidatus Dormibacteraeota bacterium]|nr:hypothetical protein [Candidatus Dormibacteraeota bacterium]